MKRLIAAVGLIASLLYSHVTTAGLTTGPSGTNNISGTLFAPLDATNVVNGMSVNGLISGWIYVKTNDINGLNTALAYLAVSTNKMMIGGGRILLQHGTHYITTALLYSNEWPASITIEGEGIPGANVVYVGPATNVNIFRFMGNHDHDGVLLSVKCQDVGFYSIYDNTNWLVQLQETGWTLFDNCRWGYWVVATNNNNRGIAMPEDFPNPSHATNMGGLYLGATDTGAGITVRNCYFQFLQHGVYDASDHAYLENLYFSLIGSASTGWPTNSPFRLGCAIIKTNGSGTISDSVYSKIHFTVDYVCLWDQDNSTEPKTISNTRVEQCTYRFVSAVPDATGSFVWENSINTAPDGIAGLQGTIWAITNTPPPFMKQTGVSYGAGNTNLAMFATPRYGFFVTPQGKTVVVGTNNAPAWEQTINLDQWTFTVTGGETEVNGTYVFKSFDWTSTLTPLTKFFIWTNTVSARTNLLVYDPTASALSIAPWAIVTQTNHVSDENILYLDSAATTVIPPATTWDPNTGTSNSITVTPTYGQWQVNPNGSELVPMLTNTGTAYIPTNTASFTIVTNDFVLNTLYTNRAQRALIQVGITSISTNTLTVGFASFRLIIDQNADNTYEATVVRVGQKVSIVSATADPAWTTNFYEVFQALQPGARFYMTNDSTSPNLTTITPSSSQWIYQ